MQRKWLGHLLLFAAAYALLGFFFSPVRFLDGTGTVIIGNTLWKVAGIISAAGLLLSCWRREIRPDKQAVLGVSLLVFCCVPFSDITVRPFTFYLNGSIGRADLVWLGLGSILLTLTFQRFATATSYAAVVALLIIQGYISYSFANYANGRLLWSDDHPSFLYRLELLRDNFPFIPFYNPAWNLGYQAREFFATGVLNVFFLVAPVLYFVRDITTAEDAAFYTLILPYLFVWIVPWSLFFASRILRFSVATSAVCALLALAPSTSLFEWALKYGTLGFSLSAGLFPLTFALAYRLGVDSRPPTYRHVVALLVVSSLCLMWTLTSLALLPLIVLALCTPKTLVERQRRAKLVGFVLLFCLLNGPWIITFLRESQVVDFVSQSTLPGAHSSKVTAPPAGPIDSLLHAAAKIEKKGLNRLREGAAKINPLILIIGLGAIALIPERRLRFAMATTAVFLVMTALVGDPLKPQLELRRVLVHLAYLLCIPTAEAVLTLERQSRRHALQRGACFGARILVLGAVGITPFIAHAAFLNRTSERFMFAAPIVSDLSLAIRTHGGNGVTLFAGFILHDLGATNSTAQNGGHIAPLATFTGKHLYASDFTHRKWSSVDPIPKNYRDRGAVGIEEFLDLINATAVVTFTRPWAEYCASQSRYREVFHEHNFRLFVRSGAPETFFYRGSGELLDSISELALVPHQSEVVLRFRYLPGLKISGVDGAELFPVPVFSEDDSGGVSLPVSFIGVRIPEGIVATHPRIRIGYFEQEEHES